MCGLHVLHIFSNLFAATLPRHYRALFFFFNDTATTEIYTLSLHDALPISQRARSAADERRQARVPGRAVSRPTRRLCALPDARSEARGDRKSTRLNSSHLVISYAVFCLKKKKERRNR